MCEKMTSSTKPEVHNALKLSRWGTAPRQKETCTEKFMKLGHIVSEIYVNGQREITNILITI